jgi:hypothetical protein
MSVQFIKFEVDLDSLCSPLVFGPRQWEYAPELKGPVYLSAPPEKLPDGHPRKPKRRVGKRLMRVLNSEIVRD